MAEQETPHPDYVTGFNEGYTISRHMPELANQLKEAVGNTERGTGFRTGREQWLQEDKEQRRPNWLGKNRLTDLDMDADKDIDKEDR